MKALQDIRIVFMGTPEFAVASLDKLVRSGCRVVAVVTAPDKAAGRGMELQQSPVKRRSKWQSNLTQTEGHNSGAWATTGGSFS